MVQFLNIKSDKDYIYADAEDMDVRKKFKIKAYKHEDKFETLPSNFTYSVGMAIWGMVDKYEKSGCTITHCSIVWG